MFYATEALLGNCYVGYHMNKQAPREDLVGLAKDPIADD
jgi:hypothetical protein